MLMDEETELFDFNSRRRNSKLNFSTFFMNLPRPSKKRKREDEQETNEFVNFTEEKSSKYIKMDEQSPTITQNSNNFDHYEKFNFTKLNSLFSLYSRDSEVLEEASLLKFQSDLNFKKDILFDFRYLIFMYFCKCKKKMVLSKTEFTNGMLHFNADSIDELCFKLNNIQSIIDDWTIGEEQNLFSFIFYFIKGSEKSKYLSTFQVIKFLNGIKEYGDYYYLDSFIDFLKSEKRNGINLDQFKLFVNFSYYIKADFSNYCLTDGWPILYDDFVIFMKKKTEMDVIE